MIRKHVLVLVLILFFIVAAYIHIIKKFTTTTITTVANSNNPYKYKILLFGAYGNGNIGDIYQPLAIKNHIHNIRKDIDIYTTSMEFGRPYDFEKSKKIFNRKTILNMEVIKKYDALLIGGGGLLEMIHRPLCYDDWSYNLHSNNVPFALLAIGAIQESINKNINCQKTLEYATFLSGRDDTSVDSLRIIRPKDTQRMVDPILSDLDLQYVSLSLLNRKPPKYNKLTDLRNCWILPSKPKNDTEKLILNYMLKNLIQINGNDILINLYPKHTKEIRQAFDKAFKHIKIFNLDHLKQFIEFIITKCDYVFSARQHGIILSVRAGLPTIGFTYGNMTGRKVQQVSEQVLGMVGCYLPIDLDTNIQQIYSIQTMEKCVINNIQMTSHLKQLRDIFQKNLKVWLEVMLDNQMI